MTSKIPKDAYVIIIGAMKCATSSLYEYLQGHPDICPASIKEPEFFSENQDHGVQVENYSDLWSFDDSVHKYALEASTGYTKYPAEPNVPKRIFDYGITPRFIYVIRNPFDRISSHYNFMHKNKSWYLDIDDTHLVNTSSYSLQLEQYRKHFPLENILVLDFDDLISNPHFVLQKTYQFLDLSHTYFPEEYRVINPTHVETKIEKIIRRLKLDALSDFVPKRLKELGTDLLQRASPQEKRMLTDLEREFLHSELKGDMSDLHRIYGFDVRKWGFDI